MADDYAGSTSTIGFVGVGGTSSGGIETAGDTDWFRINLAAGQTYRFDLRGSPSGDGTLSDPFLRLRDSAGNSITSNDDGPSNFNSQIIYTATSGGTYFLSAGSSATSGTGTYHLSATLVAAADDYAGAASTTGVVTVGGMTSGSIESAGDTDWFRITLSAGQTYRFDLKGSPSGDGTLFDPFLRLRDSAGNSITFNDDGASNLNSQISYQATSSGVYYLSAGSSGASGTGTYHLSATAVGTADTDDFAGTTSTTGVVSVGGTTSGSIDSAGDTDWFRITLTAGQTYRFDLRGSPSGDGTLSDPFLRLRDSVGNSITFNDDGPSNFNSQISYTATSSGAYFLSAGSSSASGVGTYHLAASQTAPQPAPTASGLYFSFPLGNLDASGHRPIPTPENDADSFYLGVGAFENDGDGFFSGDFGDKEDNPSTRDFHLGEDWNRVGASNADLGEKVYAIGPGTVRTVKMDDPVGTNGWLGAVIVEHPLPGGGSVFVLYGHLQVASISSLVPNVSTVDQTSQIGLIGQVPGHSPHLHIEVRTASNPDRLLVGHGYSDTPRPTGWLDPSDFLRSYSAGASEGNTVHPTEGSDVIARGSGQDTIDGLGGNDTISDLGGANYLRGGAGDDQISGGTGVDDINGNAGNDTASGGAGDDWVVGGKDNDSLSGDVGNDLVYGNLGNDTCDGGDNDDIVRGGQDNDLVRGGSGNDFLSGDKGNDTLTGGTGADIFHTFGDAGVDWVTDFRIEEGDRVQVDPGTQYTVSQFGPDTVISMTGGGQMILVGVSANSLTGSWIFGS